ncbi:MAG: hypothetical protein M1151_02830 [Candidatus Thermoplasmatota archaeon]|jgi:formate hydrogenlyase subunit 3/multisubunit Na+/H+ antiporter MnhD subunit|nr:hypothetical protein [Candidatus Thermoplasmatota archaeon]
MILPLFLVAALIPVVISTLSVKNSYRAGTVLYSLIAATSLYALMTGTTHHVVVSSYLAFSIDPLFSAFLLMISAVWAITSFFSIEYDRKSRPNAFSFHLAILSMMVVMTSESFPLFLSGWEGMTISGYFLIGFRKGMNSIPPYVFLVYGELSTLLIMVMGVGMYFQSSTMLFIADSYNQIIVFLGVMGFFIKMGVMPFQITEWLPIAHGNASTNGSILFSAAMTTVALYSILRFITISDPGEVFGLLIMGIGAFSLLFGSIYSASAEHVKMLPAYSTIENSGAMLIFTGAFIVLGALGQMQIATFALAGLLIFAFSHALSKSGLFMFSGIMEQSTGTTEIKSYRGGNNSTFYGAGGFLSSVSLAGMLPLGGGVGEWMLLETIFVMSILGNSITSLVSIIVGATAALGGGISIISMTKIFGFGSRGAHEKGRKEGPMRISLLAMGAGVILIGAFSTLYVALVSNMIGRYTGMAATTIISGALIVPNGFLLASSSSTGSFGGISPFFTALFIALFTGVLLLSFREARSRTVVNWNGGIEEEDKLHSFAYANSLRLTMKRFYLTTEERRGSKYSERTFDAFWLVIIFLARKTVAFSRIVGMRVMNSSLTAYVLYIMVAFFAVMIYIAI